MSEVNFILGYSVLTMRGHYERVTLWSEVISTRVIGPYYERVTLCQRSISY